MIQGHQIIQYTYVACTPLLYKSGNGIQHFHLYNVIAFGVKTLCKSKLEHET